MKTLLWLDDIRNPHIPFLWLVQYAPEYEYNEDGNHKVVWVKNYKEFVSWINKNGLPTIIGFDNDLGGCEEGIDAAKYIVEYCLDRGLDSPDYFVQSANPVAKVNINGLLTNFKKFQKNDFR